MIRRVRLLRLAGVWAAAGTVFQLAGCAAGLAPEVLSFLESALLDLLLSSILPP